MGERDTINRNEMKRKRREFRSVSVRLVNDQERGFLKLLMIYDDLMIISLYSICTSPSI